MRHTKRDLINLMVWFFISATISILFLTFPGLDIQVSKLFGSTSGFPLSESAILESVRDFMLIATGGAAYVALILLILRVFSKTLQVINAHFLVFVLTCAALGPGLVINGLLKRFSGRVRPRNADVFGGEGDFSPFLDFTGTCESNCSFVSAEAGAIATICTILFIAILPYIKSWKRASLQISLLSIAIFGSSLRIVVGAHFLSDVIFSWIIMVPIVFGLYAVFGKPQLTLIVQKHD